MVEKSLDQYLAPGGTDKGKKEEELGEKGVGLTYCVFMSNSFKIITRGLDKKQHGGLVKDANKWLHNGNGDIPKFEKQEFEEFSNKQNIEGKEYNTESFCSVRIEGITTTLSEDLFQKDPNQLKYILQSRTALGNTRKIWEEESPEISCYYDLNLNENSTSLERLSFEYSLPHEWNKKNSHLNEVRNKLSLMTEEKKKYSFLRDRAIWDTHRVNWNGRDIKVYGVMLPGHKVFKEINVNYLKVISAEDYEADPESTLFVPTIHISSKGIPTGVELKRPKKGGKTGYYQRCFFLIEYDYIKFDLGRKSVTWQAERKLQEAISHLFKKFEGYAKYQSDEKTEINTPEETKAEFDAEMKQKWLDANEIPDLNFDKIKYKKEPKGQEAAVAAIFHELLGADILKYYHPLVSGYAKTYDLFCLYADPNKEQSSIELVVEFKYSLESIIKDLDESIKHLHQMDLLICWDVDPDKISGFNLEAYEPGEEPYSGVTHKLETIDAHFFIPVIVLSTYISSFSKNE